MKNLNKIKVFVSVLIVVACTNKTNNVVQLKDLKTYLRVQQDDELIKTQKKIAFWNKKLEATPSQFPYKVQLAGLENQLFSKTGDIQHLKKSEQLLLDAIQKTRSKNSGYLRALAKNYISQHQFKKALDLLQKAEANGDKKQETIKMLFDVYLELGANQKAEMYLGKIENKRSFDYLIRIAKWQDYIGNLEATISYMEEALAVVQAKEYTELELWCITNLADYYGHHGDIQKSYEYYLKALELNPHNYYALKKIAWISFSNDKDVEEAKAILSFLDKNYQGVDVDLLSYEIALYENNQIENTYNSYWSQVQNSAYGDMYNAYNFDIFVHQKKYQKAYQIALKEVKNRPTAVSYSMLALATAYVQNPSSGLAIISSKNVLKSYEPAVRLRVAKVYALNNQIEKIQPLKKELLEAAFELGPVKTKEVQKL
ncbi:tetratricopeptide repeat protein [Wenyingzhuangia aestuarii]|uniref:cell surface protein n=1 Tax=Wenyingzhuangia aestuarii TaxID=1647582 RepID=UPI001438CAD8|nr:cell surface protein [Wenyingzhuangia aestuarii]NJB81415.1 thioredoxin-like negative regulator of GroEL [Wenyingzhuangia aestuarii]